MKHISHIAIAALFLSAISCHLNDDYDLRNAFVGDSTIGGELQIPVGNSREITLFRNRSVNDTADFSLQTYANGDFFLKYKFQPEEWPFEVPCFDICPEKNSYEIYTNKLHFPEDDFDVLGPFHFIVASDFKIHEDSIPKEIIELKEATGNAEFSSTILFDNTPAIISAITVLKGMKIIFPEWCNVSSFDENFFKRIDYHTFESLADVRMKNFSYSKFGFTCDRIFFDKFPQGQGLVKPGTINIDSQILLDGYFNVSSSDVKSGSTSDCEIGLTVSDKYSDFTVDEVLARIDPGASISIKALMFNELTEIESIDMENSVIDITDGFVALDIFSGIPVDALFSAKVKAYDSRGKQCAYIDIPGNDNADVVISSGKHSKYCLTENDKVIPEGYTPLLLPGLNSIIKKWPQRICTEEVSLAAAEDDFISIKVGENEEQNVTMNGYMEIPLKFGNDLKIVMKSDSLEFAINPGEGLQLNDGEVKMEIESTIPLQIDVTLQQVDSGNNQHSNFTLLPGTPEHPSLTSLSIPFTDTGGESGIIFRSTNIVISCPDDFSGVSLNSSQGIVLKDISFAVHKGITLKR